MKIANLKIGARVGCGFGMVILLLVTMVAISLVRMQAMEVRVDTMLGNLSRQLALSNELKYNVSIIHQRVRNVVIDGDTSGVKREGELIDAIRVRNDGLLKQFDAAITGAQARDLLGRIHEASIRDTAAQNEVSKLVNEFNIAGAKRHLNTAVAATEGRLVKSLNDMSELQAATMQEEARQGKAEFTSARTMLLGVTALAIALALCVARSVVLGVTRPLNAAIRVAQRVAGGDLTTRLEVTSRDEMGSLMQALKGMNDNLGRIVGDVRSGTTEIAAASRRIATENAELSARTEHEASSLQETASSMEQLTATVKQNADCAREANALALAASAVALKGGSVVGQVVNTMEDINRSAKRIVDIIAVIDGIAFQTNILALNAAVEAARAGEHGRGFAVVAAEVRTLAQRSASAAKEIKCLIDDAVGKVGIGARQVGQAGATMQDVVDSVRSVTDIMGKIDQASREQTAGIEQINRAVNNMDISTQKNAATVEGASAAAQALLDQAEALERAVSIFQVGGRALALTA